MNEVGSAYEEFRELLPNDCLKPCKQFPVRKWRHLREHWWSGSGLSSLSPAQDEGATREAWPSSVTLALGQHSMPPPFSWKDRPRVVHLWEAWLCWGQASREVWFPG